MQFYHPKGHSPLSIVEKLSNRFMALKSCWQRYRSELTRANLSVAANRLTTGIDAHVQKVMPNVIGGMRALDRLVIGLWASFTFASVAVFASAIPYIYASSDPDMRCGAFALTDLSLFEITSSLKGIITLAISFGVCRFFTTITNAYNLRLLMLLPLTTWAYFIYGGYSAVDLQLSQLNTEFYSSFPSLATLIHKDENTCRSIAKHPSPGRLLPHFLWQWNDTHIFKRSPSSDPP